MNGKGVLWVTDPRAERPLVIGKEGPAAAPPMTVPTFFQKSIEKFGNEKAMSVKREGVWKSWTYKQYYDDCVRFAKSLIHIGVQPFDCVCILGFNSPEWFIADIGGILSGGIACGIYSTNAPDACKYIIEHSEAAVVVVENEAQLKKIQLIRGELPKLKAIVQWMGQVPNEEGVYSWETFMGLGSGVGQDVLQARMDAQKPTQACTLIYTSGTTGPPKAVMLSHDNCTWTCEAMNTVLSVTAADVFVSYLPLSHIAAQMCDIYVPIAYGAAVHFAQPDALKGTLPATLKEVRPTVFLGVPRVWEKIADRMKEIGRSSGTVKRHIATWAKGVGLHGNYALQRNQSVPWGWWLANTVVFSKIRQALGLDRARLLGTAAAPIAKETLDYFLSLNIPIFEIYGMSETTGPETATFPGRLRTGSAGAAIPGSELRIENPDAEGNGEICWRGRHVFLGYMKNDQATAETIDAEGFLHSGDIGKLDADGFLYITGRIKELIITAGGENIPPVVIEEEIKKEIGMVVSNVMVVGDRRKFLACLITIRANPVANHVEGQYPFTDEILPSAVKILEEKGIKAKTIPEAQNDQDLHKWITNGINAANKRATSNAQQVRKFKILEQDFALENETLTPSLKLKRRVVLQKYAGLIDQLYEEAEREMGASV